MANLPSPGALSDVRTDRVWRIDVLRGVAILLVLFGHGLLRIFGDLGYSYLAEAGVALFFVISGFCIHSGFLRGGSQLPLWYYTRKFWWRRCWRIYPAYLVALVVLWVVTREEHPGAVHFWSHLLLIHNLSAETFWTVSAAFWSLAAEWQIYLIYPFLLWLRQQIGPAKTFAIVASVSAGLRLFGFLTADTSAPLNPAFWLSPAVLLFDWTLGAWLAEAWVKGERVKALEWLALPAATLFPFVWRSPFGHVFAFTIFALISAGAMSLWLASNQPQRRWSMGVAWVGLISYSLYLWHMPLLGRMLFYLGAYGSPSIELLGFLFGVVPLLLLGSWLSRRWIEKPGEALGRWLKFPSGSKIGSPAIEISPQQ